MSLKQYREQVKKIIDCRRRLKIYFYFFLYVHNLDFTCKKLTNYKLEYFTGCKQDRCTKLLYGVFRNHLTHDIRRQIVTPAIERTFTINLT